MRTCIEGPPIESFDANKYVEAWANNAIRRPKQVKRKKFARSTAPPKKAKVLVDCPSSSESDISDDEDSDESTTLNDV